MAQVWTAVRMQDAGAPGPLNVASGKRLTKTVFYSCTGPLSSVADGAIISFAADFTKSQFVDKGHFGSSNEMAYSHEYIASTGASAALGKIVTMRRSTGAKLTANTDLSSQVLYIRVEGY